MLRGIKNAASVVLVVISTIWATIWVEAEMVADRQALFRLGVACVILLAFVGVLHCVCWRRDRVREARRDAFEALFIAYRGYGAGWDFCFYNAQEAVRDLLSVLPKSVKQTAPPPLQSRDDLLDWLDFVQKRVEVVKGADAGKKMEKKPTFLLTLRRYLGKLRQ